MFLLNQIKIILVNTTLPANIGSVARAMHTMGLSALTVVEPRLPIDQSSYANATAGAFILDAAHISPTLEDALQDCGLIFMASARNRHIPKPVVNPQQSALLAQKFLAHNPHTKIAVVFGREDRGLTNDELALADYHIQIPANPSYPVLNIASSVQVIASHFYQHFCHELPSSGTVTLPIICRTDWDVPAIEFSQKNALEQQLIDLLVDLGLADDLALKDLPKRLSRLLSRLQLDQKEYRLIKTTLIKLKQRLNHPSP